MSSIFEELSKLASDLDELGHIEIADQVDDISAITTEVDVASGQHMPAGDAQWTVPTVGADLSKGAMGIPIGDAPYANRMGIPSDDMEKQFFSGEGPVSLPPANDSDDDEDMSESLAKLEKSLKLVGLASEAQKVRLLRVAQTQYTNIVGTDPDDYGQALETEGHWYTRKGEMTNERWFAIIKELDIPLELDDKGQMEALYDEVALKKMATSITMKFDHEYDRLFDELKVIYESFKVTASQWAAKESWPDYIDEWSEVNLFNPATFDKAEYESSIKAAAEADGKSGGGANSMAQMAEKIAKKTQDMNNTKATLPVMIEWLAGMYNMASGEFTEGGEPTRRTQTQPVASGPREDTGESGSSGVRAVQEALGGIDVDGIWGDETQGAWNDFVDTEAAPYLTEQGSEVDPEAIKTDWASVADSLDATADYQGMAAFVLAIRQGAEAGEAELDEVDTDLPGEEDVEEEAVEVELTEDDLRRILLQLSEEKIPHFAEGEDPVGEALKQEKALGGGIARRRVNRYIRHLAKTIEGEGSDLDKVARDLMSRADVADSIRNQLGSARSFHEEKAPDVPYTAKHRTEHLQFIVYIILQREWGELSGGKGRRSERRERRERSRGRRRLDRN